MQLFRGKRCRRTKKPSVALSRSAHRKLDPRFFARLDEPKPPGNTRPIEHNRRTVVHPGGLQQSIAGSQGKPFGNQPKIYGVSQSGYFSSTAKVVNEPAIVLATGTPLVQSALQLGEYLLTELMPGE